MATQKTTTAPAQRATTGATDSILTVNMTRTKETKGAWRYDAPDNEAARIGGPLNLYVRKDSVKGEPPQNVTLTLTPMA